MARKKVQIRDHSFEASLFWRRALFCLLVVVVCFGALVTNLYHLQIEEHKQYQVRSNDNRIKLVPVAPNRGIIYDRNGVVLAENRPVYSLEVVPEQVKSWDEPLKGLQQLLDIDDDTISDFKESLKGVRRFNRVTLLEEMTEKQVAEFSVNQYRYPGFSVEGRLKRYYPYGDAMTHVLGYVARINDKDLQDLADKDQLSNYAATHEIGKLGVERYYESLLHGQVGYMEVEVNNRGRVIRTLRFEPPVPGKDLYLNIDLGLQLKAQELLAGHRGSIVAMDPHTGGILAMASAPSYDPNLFVRGITSKEYNKLLHSPDRPLINRSTQGRYPPASTVKPFMALVGLEEGEITPTSKIWDPGYFELPNVDHKWRDWKRWGHGWVDMKKAISESCDTYFYQLALNLGIDRIHNWMTKFGFGQYSGIDIHEETNGVMPSRSWKERRFRQPWYIGDTIPIGIGQSYWTVTPVQLATAVTIMANAGVYHTPKLLMATGSPTGIIKLPPEDKPEVKASPLHWHEVEAAMRFTVTSPHGSAHKALNDAPYTATGKTGTAQVINIGQDEKYDAKKVAERHRDNAMFITYAPYETPKIVVAVALENVIGGGGSVAAPLARQVLDYYLLDEGHLKDDEASHD
ncbi:penicillin-binding protein 2 [Gallaecimonas pentaromativorans]|uniref:Peptidoglycan D,D-transpeptidase MrdA n=1 Tax=Gallaecimonas pentaromativorans TaxID=584787 RepID=A0A3N1PGG9_9GAMM|nr:penicillin-binding protein 2 [Gallaecimonas pentaromativorans]ROQ25970.1 penicillin-binding protein 2 [Gallaecimonas pentaromativorans]